MQSNDINVMMGKWDLEDLHNPFSPINNIRMSALPTNGRIVSKEDIMKLKETKVPVSEAMLLEVRKTITYYEQFGKSRRWIRRYIKRKFNITEY